ncbi:unnamed protein product [Allacma fusca]|uniref:Uncharacterized protein n=1 Tax=Allacma fusca TaxID=39272 RepID=A0A8J2L5P9_9HEXA|nr:unnamed protein product [Allacma fusca]
MRTPLTLSWLLRVSLIINLAVVFFYIRRCPMSIPVLKPSPHNISNLSNLTLTTLPLDLPNVQQAVADLKCSKSQPGSPINLSSRSNFYAGRVISARGPERNNKSVYYLSEADFAPSVFPPFIAVFDGLFKFWYSEEFFKNGGLNNVLTIHHIETVENYLNPNGSHTNVSTNSGTKTTVTKNNSASTTRDTNNGTKNNLTNSTGGNSSFTKNNNGTAK